MIAEWEKYVEQAAEALLAAGFVDPDDGTVPKYRGADPIPVWVPAEEAARALLEAVVPLIERDTRERIVAAAARVVAREGVQS